MCAVLHVVSLPILRLDARQSGATLERRTPREGPLSRSVYSSTIGVKGSKLDHIDEDIHRLIATVRSKAEHLIRVIKRELGHAKTRYRVLAKNRSLLFALSNLLLMRRRLLALNTLYWSPIARPCKLGPLKSIVRRS